MFQALQGWQIDGLPIPTEGPPEFINTKASIMTLALEHTKGGQAAGEVRQLNPLRAGLTAA
jgi:hypothetical protein